MTLSHNRLSFVAALVLAAACGTKEAPSALDTGPTGRVRFVNLINDPARNPVNAILENVPWGVSLSYTATTPGSLAAPNTAPYSAILTGDRTLVVKRTADTTVTLATITFPIATDEDKTIYVTGGAGGGAVTNVITTDANPAPATTETRFRIANMSPTAGSVDVFVTAAGADLTGLTPDAAGLAPGTVSAYFTKTPGSYTVRFVPAGTAPPARNSSVTLTLASTPFAGGTGRTIVAADRQQGGAPLQAFVLTDR
jgi:hypothetical protein